MRKKLILLFMLLANSGMLFADGLTVGDVVIPKGGQGMIVVNYQFDVAEQYSGWQFSLYMPEQVSTVKSAKGTSLFNAGSCHDESYTITSSYSEGVDGYVALSLETSPITGTNDMLISIPVEAIDNLEVGTSYQASLKDIQFGNKDGIHTSFFDDVTFTITIGEPDDGRIKFDENAVSLPSYTAGEKGNVSMTRTIKAGQWSTIVLPFTLTKAKAEAIFGSDVQLAEFAGFEVTYSDEEDLSPDAIAINLSAYAMTAKKGMTGGKPFFIKTSKDIESFEADDVTLFREITDVSKADEYDTPGKLTGTLVKSKIPADGLFISDNKFWYSTGNTNVKAFRAWFELGAVLNKDTDFGSRISMVFDDDTTTGISSLSPSLSQGEGAVYDLQGRRVDEPKAKGIYIVNGKKIKK